MPKSIEEGDPVSGNTLTAQRKTLIQWAVSIVIPLLLLVIPLGPGVTADMRLFMCVTLMFILLAAFDLASVVILTIFLACGYIVTGVATPTEALSAWTNTILYLLTSGVVLSKVLEETGLFRRISLWIISKCGGSFNKLYIGLYIACLLIAMLSFCQAWLLSVVLAVELCRGMNLKQGKESAVLMSAVMMGTLSSSFYTFDPLYLPLLDGAIKVVDPNAAVYWYDFYLYMLPYIPLSFLFMFLIMKIYKTKNWGT